MSYNVRDDEARFGPKAAVEFLAGAGAPTVCRLVATTDIGYTAPTATQLAASTNYTIYVAPPVVAGLVAPLGTQWQIVGATHFYATAAGSAATYTIEVCPSGTANGSGRAAVTSAALNTALSNVPAALTLSTSVANLVVNNSDRINLIVASTATTSLVDFNVTIYLARVN